MTFTPNCFTFPVTDPNAFSAPASESRRSFGSVSSASATPSGSPSASRSMRTASARRTESARAAMSRARCSATGVATNPVSRVPSQGRSTASESTVVAKRSAPLRPATSPSVPAASRCAPRATSESVSTRARPSATASLVRKRSTRSVSHRELVRSTRSAASAVAGDVPLPRAAMVPVRLVLGARAESALASKESVTATTS